MGDLDRLADDLRDGASGIDGKVEAVVKRGSLNIKGDWSRLARVSGGEHAPFYYRSISFDVFNTGGRITGETGPDKDRPQGALGNLLEFGSVHNPPQNDGGQALRAEEPRFIRSVGDAAGDLL